MDAVLLYLISFVLFNFQVKFFCTASVLVLFLGDVTDDVTVTSQHVDIGGSEEAAKGQFVTTMFHTKCRQIVLSQSFL